VLEEYRFSLPVASLIRADQSISDVCFPEKEKKKGIGSKYKEACSQFTGILLEHSRLGSLLQGRPQG
jgi:hypothetical protein